MALRQLTTLMGSYPELRTRAPDKLLLKTGLPEKRRLYLYFREFPGNFASPIGLNPSPMLHPLSHFEKISDLP